MSTHNPCQIDAQRTCLDHRHGNREAPNCCIKNHNKQPCAQLGPVGCTTTNIACKSHFCKTAQEVLVQKEFLNIGVLVWIQAIRSVLHNSFNPYETHFHEMYFEKEEVVREILGLNYL